MDVVMRRMPGMNGAMGMCNQNKEIAHLKAFGNLIAIIS